MVWRSSERIAIDTPLSRCSEDSCIENAENFLTIVKSVDPFVDESKECCLGHGLWIEP